MHIHQNVLIHGTLRIKSGVRPLLYISQLLLKQRSSAKTGSRNQRYVRKAFNFWSIQDYLSFQLLFATEPWQEQSNQLVYI